MPYGVYTTSGARGNVNTGCEHKRFFPHKLQGASMILYRPYMKHEGNEKKAISQSTKQGIGVLFFLSVGGGGEQQDFFSHDLICLDTLIGEYNKIIKTSATNTHKQKI